MNTAKSGSRSLSPIVPRLLSGLLLLLAALTLTAQMAPTYTVTPPSGQPIASLTTPVEFVFSQPMNVESSQTFFTAASGEFIEVATTWSLNNTKLSCLPSSGSWPNDAVIQWMLVAMSAAGGMIIPPPTGTFSTGEGGSSGGGGTNAVPLFAVGVLHSYTQSDANAPVLSDMLPGAFSASATLASNQTATAVTLDTPQAATKSLSQNPIEPEQFYLFSGADTLAALDSEFPAGPYDFTVTGEPNQEVSVTLLSLASQPPAPHVVNYTAAQTVDPNQDFTLTWDAWNGGTAADYIQLTIEGDYSTPDPSTPGALLGTATSALIPQGKLQPDTEYTSATLTFFRTTSNTNSATYHTMTFRSTITEFSLRTSGGGATGGPVTLTNATLLAGGMIQFQVVAAAGQTVTLETSDTLAAGSWSTWFSTNTPTGTFTVTDAAPATSRRFYRSSGQ